jgi:hypothetical protein
MDPARRVDSGRSESSRRYGTPSEVALRKSVPGEPATSASGCVVSPLGRPIRFSFGLIAAVSPPSRLLQRHVRRDARPRPGAAARGLLGLAHRLELLSGADPHLAPPLQLPGVTLVQVDERAWFVVLAVVGPGYVH